MAFSRVNIEKVTLNEASFPTIRIDRISPGKTIIRELQLQDLELGTKNASLTLQGITIDMKLSLFLDYRFSGIINKQGTAFAMGEIQIGLDVGDVKIDVPDLVTSINETTIQDLEVNIAPIEQLILPGIVAKVLELNNLRLPGKGFKIGHGINLKGMEMSDLTIPDALATRIAIKSLGGMNITMPGIELPEISLEFDAESMDLKKVEAKVSKEKQCTPWVTILSIPIPPSNFSFDARVCAQPETTLTIDKLTIANIKQSLKLKKTKATNLVLPFDVLGIQLTDLKIKGIEIPQVKVA